MGRRITVGVLSFICLAAAPKKPATPAKDAGAAAPPASPKLVITEIMYDPLSGESDEQQTEWVEIRNVGAQTASLQGLQLTSGTRNKPGDDKQKCVLPDVQVAPGQHVVIGVGSGDCYAALGLPKFAAHAGEAKYAWLTNTGDGVALRTSKGAVIDEVIYTSESPWPDISRAGSSIQFHAPGAAEDPTEANDDPANWVASVAGNSEEFDKHGRGTPGGPPGEGAGATTRATTKPIARKK